MKKTMDNNTTNYAVQAPSLTTLLGLLFIALKLIGVIDWAWVWVLAPIWISWALILVLLVLIRIAYVIKSIATKN